LDDEDLARRALALLPPDARPDRLALALAARPIGAAELGRLLNRLGYEAPDRNVIVQAATRAAKLCRALTGARRASEIAAAASGASPEAVALAGALGAELPARDWLERLRGVGLEIDGDDLLAAGVPQGPAVGRALRAALSAKLDGEASGRTEELTVALRSAEADG
jgi:tRNA nucleotidyltransferase (CCA-adding enzyme)